MMGKTRLQRIAFLTVSILLIATVIIGVVFYNNQFYARKVIKAIEIEDITGIKNLTKWPLGNLNSKPTLWLFDVVSENVEPTPLQAACRLGNPKIVELLLENGADVNYTHWDKTRDFGSPLMNAASSLSEDRLKVIKILVENGADVHYESDIGNDVLTCAVYASMDRTDTIEIIEYLEQKGSDIYKKYGETKDTLLHKACEADNFLVIQYLIDKRGFDINSVNEDGDTPLIYFLRFDSNRKEETLRFLIENGADINAKNKDGKTALDYAIQRHPEFVKSIRQGKTGDGS